MRLIAAVGRILGILDVGVHLLLRLLLLKLRDGAASPHHIDLPLKLINLLLLLILFLLLPQLVAPQVLQQSQVLVGERVLGYLGQLHALGGELVLLLGRRLELEVVVAAQRCLIVRGRRLRAQLELHLVVRGWALAALALSKCRWV